MINELGLNNDNNRTSTYTKAGKLYFILSENIWFLKKTFNLDATDTNKKVPNTYWTPKLHKNLTKAKFIIAPPKCSVKPLLKAVRGLKVDIQPNGILYHQESMIFWC